MKIPALNSIVVGDVGSGKTAVAFSVGCAYLLGLKKGIVTMMAPTEIVAVQHYNNLLNYAKELEGDIAVVCLTQKNKLLNGGKISKKKLAEVFEQNNRIFVVGTQAILFQGFQADMVLVDEQHRFGVLQRGSFAEQEKHPHYISFSATPIPRTLALTIYKHLDIQKLERLDGRSPITTRIIPMKSKNELVSIIQHHTNSGNKIFIVTSAIEEDETNELILSQKQAFDWLCEYFPSDSIIVTHGREKEKVEKLQRFRDDKDLSICIATSVIEVGVDVGAATVMVVLNAERFGLAALHQLRGRIGRNSRNDNVCILVPATYSPRLEILSRTQDGFVIAEEDLNQRGAGTLVGTNQSGFDTLTQSLIELDPNTYEKLSQAVESVNFEDASLARLKNYVYRKFQETWKE